MGDPNQSFDPTKAPTSQTQNNLTDTIGEELFKSYQKINESLFPARIYRVPEDLRKLNKSAYIPRIISIGPLHCKEAHLQTPMQDVKKHYAYYLFSRVTEGVNNEDQKGEKKSEVLLECVEKMKHCVDRAKKYYAEELKLNDDDMVKMLLVDGCFILELLYTSYQTNKSKAAEEKTTNGRDCFNPKGQDLIDPIFDNILTGAIVKQDLILLENQIPFFVLEHLFKVTVAKISGANKLSLEDYVRSYWESYIKVPEYENSGSKKTSCFLSVGECVLSVGHRSTKESAQAGKADQYHHILHLLHDFFLPDDHHVVIKQKKLCGLEVSASDLHYAGVNFAPAENNNLFNVEFEEPQGIRWWFHGAKFKIPTLNVDDSTETFLRNLIALEQCCPGVRRHFTSYAKFMDMLIDSDKDVDVLEKAGVIRNNLGAYTDVAHLFNNLCKEVVVGEFYFNDKYHDAYKYSKYWWPKWMAHWKRKYSASPWAFRAVGVGIIGFGIALTQFIRSFL